MSEVTIAPTERLNLITPVIRSRDPIGIQTSPELLKTSPSNQFTNTRPETTPNTSAPDSSQTTEPSPNTESVEKPTNPVDQLIQKLDAVPQNDTERTLIENWKQDLFRQIRDWKELITKSSNSSDILQTLSNNRTHHVYPQGTGFNMDRSLPQLCLCPQTNDQQGDTLEFRSKLLTALGCQPVEKSYTIPNVPTDTKGAFQIITSTQTPETLTSFGIPTSIPGMDIDAYWHSFPSTLGAVPETKYLSPDGRVFLNLNPDTFVQILNHSTTAPASGPTPIS